MRLLTSLMLLFGSLVANGQELEESVQKIADMSSIPGFTISIVNSEGVLFQEAYGYANREESVVLRTDHSQIIGSVTKTFIGFSLMKCAELGLVDLDTDINTYLPFQVKNPNNPEAKITVKHLATHTSGIADNIPDQLKIYFNEDPYQTGSSFSGSEKKLIDEILQNKMRSLSEILQSIFSPEGEHYSKKNFLKSEPGLTYQYSNTASSLAALIVEEVSGMSFEAFDSVYILDPLGMRNSTFYPAELPKDQRVIHYNGDEPKPLVTYTHRLRPIGGLSTSIEDLSVYLIEMIKGYSGEGTLLDKSSYDLLFEKQFEDDNLPDKHPTNESNQAIFWTYRGNLVGHTGGALGASAFLFFDTTTGIGKIFLTNSELEASKEFVWTFQQVWTEMTVFEKKIK